MEQEDTLQRFLYEHQPIRAAIVRLQHTYETVSTRYSYPSEIHKLLGQALAATSLLTPSLKSPGRLTLQLHSEGPITLLVVQSNQLYQVRGLAKWNQEITTAFIPQAFINGQMAITVTPKTGGQYQGVVQLAENSTLSSAIETYFEQSEQLPTAVKLYADDNCVLGIILQILPDKLQQEHDDLWQQLNDRLAESNGGELLAQSNQEILKKLAPDNNIELLDTQPITFHCDCTVARMESAIRVMGQEEADEILKTQKFVTVTCEFCHNQHDFDAAAVSNIFTGESDNDSTH